MAGGHFREGLELGHSETANQRGMQRETGWLMGALVLKEPWAVVESLKISWFKAWFAERSKARTLLTGAGWTSRMFLNFSFSVHRGLRYCHYQLSFTCKETEAGKGDG